MSAYEELVKECVTMLEECFGADPEDDSYVRAVLDVARRRLKHSTSEMNETAQGLTSKPAIWLAMLRASALEPPK